MWDKITDVLTRLPVHVLLIVLGFVLVLLGTLKLTAIPRLGTYEVEHPGVLIVVGILMMVAGVTGWAVTLAGARNLANPGDKLSSADYKVEFTVPRDNAPAPTDTVDAVGTLSKELPEGYRLWMVRRWPSQKNQFFAVQEAQVSRNRDGTAFEWSITRGYIGGGAGEVRILEMWLAGPDGVRMLNSWYAGMSQYWRLMTQTNTAWVEPWTFPGIPEATSDMTLAATIVVNRV